MISKEFNYYMEKKLKHKLELMVKRLDKRDMWILVDGEEGDGKTNMEAYLLHWFHCNLGRDFDIKCFHYSAKDLVEAGQNKPNLLLGYDEAAIGGLSNQWWSQEQLNLIQFIMTGRVMHHVVVICVPRFSKLKDTIIERCKCLIHCYVRKRDGQYRFLYLTDKKKNQLYEYYKRKKTRPYNKFKRFGGYVPEVFHRLFNEDERNEYDKRKKELIANIGVKKVDNDKKEYHRELVKLWRGNFPIESRADLAFTLGLTYDQMRMRAERMEKSDNLLGKSDFRTRTENNITNNGEENNDAVAKG